jgi:hypothetical protein
MTSNGGVSPTSGVGAMMWQAAQRNCASRFEPVSHRRYAAEGAMTTVP